MIKLKSYSATILLLLLFITDGIHTAAVGKGVGGGGRGVKGMRHNSRGRKGGAPRPVMTSSGIRANANVVLEHANNPLHPHGGMRRPDEADAYYNNPYGARVVDASHFESEYILGRKLSFYCMAQGIPRPHITWLKDGIELYAHPFFQVHEYKVGKDRIKSKMEIDPATQKDGGFYECQADNKYAVDRRGFRTDFTLDVY